MKKKYSYKSGNKTVDMEYTYIPVRYIIAILLSALIVAAIIGVVVLLCYLIPYFYLAAFATEVVCIVKIIASDDNPDYKVPWLLFVIILPIAGFMLYLMFYSRTLKKKFIKRREELLHIGYESCDGERLDILKSEDPSAHGQAKLLTEIADSHVFTKTEVRYFPLGENMHESMLADLESAERFIYMEYFIIEEGRFWNSILGILRKKASEGVDVKVIFDDIGCMTTLPGNYAKKLRAFGIDATVFSRLRGSADSEFNNRNHRKITVIDGRIGYTGGVNLADEYINEVERFGHWKDTGVRLVGDAVAELTRLFCVDFGMNKRRLPTFSEHAFPTDAAGAADGFVIPFGDGPRPIYERRVGKQILKTMLSSATERVYLTSPYLVLGDDLLSDIENTAMRGVDVRIVVPHIPDKKLVFELTRSYYKRLMSAGVKIYEYTPGFIHSKCYIADGRYAMIGTINLDHRSLAHHFENGVWMYGCECLSDIEKDMMLTFEKSELITEDKLKIGVIRRILRQTARIFAPLM